MAKKISGREMTVEQKLEALFKLQTILSKIDEIKTLRGELPLEVGDLADEIEGLTTRIGKLNDETDTMKGDIAVMRGKIDEATALVQRYEEQLNDVKNNREYDMLTKEIEYQKLEIELQEKRIRECEKGISERAETLQESRQMLDERRADLDIKKAELEEIIAETRAEEEKLREKANNLEMTIEPRLLTSFKRIRRRNSSNGLGIVYVQRDACGGCFNKIPPQRQLDIRMRKKIIVCEYCGRIMIDPELAGIKIEKSTDKPKRKRPSRAKKAEE